MKSWKRAAEIPMKRPKLSARSWRPCAHCLFFPGRKVVWMKNCNFLGSVTGKSSATEAALDSLRQLLEAGLGPDVILVVSASEFDKRRSFNKFLLQHSATAELNKPDITKAGWEGSLMPLVNKEAAARGMAFDPSALELFIHRVSESSRQIISEIEKLDLFLGAERRTVMPEDVERMVPLTRTGVIFEISAGAGKTRRATRPFP